jgi:hypothetical protein
MNTKLTLYEELELLPLNSLRPSLKTKVARWLRQLGAELVKTLVPSNQPRITLRSGPNGTILFDGYDPVTTQRIRGASEVEMRIWLKQLHL